MREIEGLLSDDVNTYEGKRTTHIRLFIKDKKRICAEAKRDNNTTAEYMQRIVKGYLGGPLIIED